MVNDAADVNFFHEIGYPVGLLVSRALKRARKSSNENEFVSQDYNTYPTA